MKLSELNRSRPIHCPVHSWLIRCIPWTVVNPCATFNNALRPFFIEIDLLQTRGKYWLQAFLCGMLVSWAGGSHHYPTFWYCQFGAFFLIIDLFHVGSKSCCTDSAVDFTEEPYLILIGSQNSLECTDSYVDSVWGQQKFVVRSSNARKLHFALRPKCWIERS